MELWNADVASSTARIFAFTFKWIARLKQVLGRFLIAQYFALKAKLTFIKFLEKLGKNISVAVPDLQIMGGVGGGGGGHQDPEIRSGAGLKKKTKRFRALRASVWSKNKAGALPWIRHCEFGVTIFKNDKIVR